MKEGYKSECKHPDCKYRDYLGTGMPYCDYLSMEGHSRGCEIKNCNKYVSIKRKESRA